MKTLIEEHRYYGTQDMFNFAKENGMTKEILNKLIKHRPELWSHYKEEITPRPTNIRTTSTICSSKP